MTCIPTYAAQIALALFVIPVMQMVSPLQNFRYQFIREETHQAAQYAHYHQSNHDPRSPLSDPSLVDTLKL